MLPQRDLEQTPVENEFVAVSSTTVRKPLVAIILSNLKCMFYSISKNI